MDNVFTDKNGREIVIDYDNLDIVARHGLGEVGRLEFLEIEGDHNSSLFKAYAGIGKNQISACRHRR